MKRRTLIMGIIGLAALAVALVVARTVAADLQKSVVMAPVVVARDVIPPYTVITNDMLAVKEFPREVTRAGIYTEAADLAGKVARTEILPAAPIYRSYAVPPAEARLADDLRSTVVSLKVDTARAVGGLVTPGQRVDVWRVAKGQSLPNQDPDRVLAVHGASVELLAHDLRVLAVSSSQGMQVAGPSGSAAPLASKAGDKETAGKQGPESISVVAVEAAQGVAPALVRLMGEIGGSYDVWLTLSPLERDAGALAVNAARTAEPRPAVVSTETPEPTAQPTLAPTPTTQPTPTTALTQAAPAGAVVRPGPTQGLNVRQGPGTQYPVLSQLVAGTSLVLLARDDSGQWLYVQSTGIGCDGAAESLGWVAAGLVDMQGVDPAHLPARAGPPLPAATPETAQPTPKAPSETATPANGYQAEVAYRNEPGEAKLNYVRARAVTADGAPLSDQTIELAWPDGAVRCPGNNPVKEDGWCEFVVTEGTFSVRLQAEGAQPAVVYLPQNGQHTVAIMTWRRLR